MASRLLIVAVVLLAACAGSPAASMPGVVTVTFFSSSPTDTNLVLSTGTMKLSHLEVSGDAPPMYPPTLPERKLDLTNYNTVAQAITGLAPGLYDLVQFDYHAIMMTGTWRTVPFSIHIEPVGMPQVSVRADVAHELGENEDVTFGIFVGVASWFAGDLLDSAMSHGGVLVCDGASNPFVSMELAQRISMSFSTE
ncbi:MAG: hypothetical protein ABI445_07495 [Polyangia bacterium]